MYQSASHRRTAATADPIQVVLVFDIPDGSAVSADRTAYLADEYGRLIAASIPGVRVHEAVVSPAEASDGRLRPVAGLSIDRAGREVRVDGERVRMTYREMELLCYIAAQPRRVVTRHELIAEVWRDWSQGDSQRTVDTHVRRVRAKLGRFASVLTTIRGRGYRFDPGPEVLVAA